MPCGGAGRTDCKGAAGNLEVPQRDVLAIFEVDRRWPTTFEVQLLYGDPLAILQDQGCVVSKVVETRKAPSGLLSGGQLVASLLVLVKRQSSPDHRAGTEDGDRIGFAPDER